jgi:hypothetical protein
MFVVQGKNVVRCRKVPPVPMLPEKPPDNTVEPEEQFRTKVDSSDLIESFLEPVPVGTVDSRAVDPNSLNPDQDTDPDPAF